MESDKLFWCSMGMHNAPLSHFGSRRNGMRVAYCGPCRSAYHSARGLAAGRRLAFERLLGRCGLTAEAFEAMNAAQGGECAMCRELPAEGARLCVDYDPETTHVRALVCVGCARTLGAMGARRAELVTRAARYLEAPASGPAVRPYVRRVRKLARAVARA